MMKKNLLFLFVFLCTFLTLHAQTTVTNSVIPSANDLLKTRQATSIGSASITAPGTNMSWDFSSMVGGPLDTVTVQAASSGMFGSIFPNADIILNTSILPGENYMDISTDKVEIVGFAGDVLGHYPVLLSYLNDSLGLASTGITVDSLKIDYAAGGHYVVDSWGNLTVPEAGSFDVLRLEQTIISNVGAKFKGSFAGFVFDWTDPSGIAGFPPVPFLGIFKYTLPLKLIASSLDQFTKD